MTPARTRRLTAGIRSATGAPVAILLLTGAFVAGAGGSVLARQGQPAAVSVWVDVEEVVPDEVRDTPGAVTTLTDRELRTFRPYTLHDAFTYVPGVRTIDDDVLGRRSGIGVRGAPSRRSRKTLLLEDGTPINASAYLDPSAHYTPPLERLERIDVLKGTGHILHGPLNNHGIVNFRNKRPTAAPLTTAEIGFGSQGTFKRHLMHRRTDGPIGLVLAYSGAHGDGAFDVERHRFDDLFAGADWEVAERHELSVSSTYFRERSHYDESNLTPQEFAVAPRTKRGRFGQEINTIAVNYAKVDLVHRFRSAGGLSASTKLFATNLDRPRFTVDPGDSPIDRLPLVIPEDPFVPGAEGTMVSRDRHYRTYGVENRMERAGLRAFGRDHALQWGLRVERHLFDDRRTEGAPGQVLDAGDRGELVRDEAYDASAVSAFVQDAIHAGRWTVTPGVRVERYTQRKHRKPSRDRPAGAPPEEDANTLVLPAISLLYNGWRDTHLFVNAGRGYTPAFARTAAEFPLEPETGINTQVGVRSAAIKGVDLEGAFFYNVIHDTVVQLPFTIDNQNIFLNSEDSRSFGVDAGLRINSAPFTNAPYNVFGQLAWTWTHAAFTAGLVEGNRIPEVPRHSGSVTLGVEHRAGWHVNATVSHFGRFFTDPLNTPSWMLADEDGVVLGRDEDFDVREPVVLGPVPSHTLLSVSAGVTIPGTPMTLWLQGRNLTDRLYVTDLANGLRPGAPRTVTAGLRIEF